MVCEVTETFDLRVQVDICDNSKEFPAAHSGYTVNRTDRIKTVKRRLSLLKLTLEVMNSSLVSMSGVRRQARNFLEVRAVRSWRTPGTHHRRQGTKRVRGIHNTACTLRIVGNVVVPVN